MTYLAVHRRESIGGRLHQTFAEKKVEVKKEEQRLSKLKSSLGAVSNGLPREKVSTEYLVPEVEYWVETEPVKALKEKVKNWLSLNWPVHIIGPTGCGKTTLSLRIAKELGRPVVWLNGDESVTTTDLIGGYSEIEVTTIRDKYIHNVFKDKDILKADWVDNPLTLACKYGYTLIYNEFSRAKPSANNVLLSVFSEGVLELPTQFGEERYVKVHPDFRAIFTSNPVEYAGVHRAQDALLDRMVGVYMDYYDRESEVGIVMAHTKVDRKDAAAVVDLVRKVREKLPEAEKIGTRACVMVAHMLKKVNKFDKQSIKALLEDVIATKTKTRQDFLNKVRILDSV